ncbi:hypothetical protein [Bordetella ansorpii]|uniref:hypothetical protein n=1 Tax=Bordetella ansorpii TaxID=288768 RepID=UPI000ACF61BE
MIDFDVLCNDRPHYGNGPHAHAEGMLRRGSFPRPPATLKMPPPALPRRPCSAR